MSIMDQAKVSSEPLPKTFQERFCELYQCPQEQFAERLFWRCLHRRALPFAWLIRWLKPRFFALDYELMTELREVRDTTELLSLIQGYRQDCEMKRSFLHEQLRIRISGHRVIMLFRRLGNPG